MKTVLLFVFGATVCSLLAFKSFNYELKKNTAEVDQEDGMYIFYRSKPIKEYEYLGTYKIGLVWDDKPSLLFNKLIRKTKEKFPRAQAIIIDNDMGKCDAIIFK